MSNTKIFDTLLEPVFIVNVTGGFAYCNAPAALICDLSERRVLRSKRLQDIVKFEVEIPWLNELEKINDSTPYIEVTFQTYSGKTGKVQITAQPFEKINDLDTILIYFRDVTLEENLQKKYRAELEQKEKYIKDLENARNELENYSKNLERMVEERTFEIRQLNSTMTALLDSLSQGFFLFNKDGICQSVASKACLPTLECNPVNQYIWDVLKVPSNRVDGFKKWLFTIFSEMLPFEDLAPLGPNSFTHSEGKHIHLEYYPLRNSDEALDSIVVVATDTTHLDQAKTEAEQEKSYAKLVINLVRKKKEITQFISETRVLLDHLNAELTLLKNNDSRFNIESLLRHLHTIKGGSATFSLFDVAKECHSAENIASQLKDPGVSSESIESLSTSIQRINFCFDQFLSDNQFILGTAAIQGIRTVEVPITELKQLTHDLNRNTEIKKWAEKIETDYLLTKLENIFKFYDDTIIQIAEVTGKKVAPLKIIGGSITVFEKHYSELFASLVHQFRNAVDHGIETEEIRNSLGKKAEGCITVNSYIISGPKPFLKIEISDDGKGIDPQVIRSKLINKGVAIDNENDFEIIQHVFDSQFSTRDQVSETSGRGVGMDAIQIAAKNIGGKAWIQSQIGKGSTLHIEVPYIQTERIQNNSTQAA